jgi:transcriptional regulator with XRE-family HTH domain
LDQARNSIGARIKRLRQLQGLSRQDIAVKVRVDVTAVSGWEAGKYAPRPSHRLALARALETDIDALFSTAPDAETQPVRAAVVDTLGELPSLLVQLLGRTQNRLQALRLAAPYPTPAYIQMEFRAMIGERLHARSIEVQRIEIFYSLDRLMEVLANIIRYDGCAYHVKAYCVGTSEVAPAIGGYFFDESDFLLGAYWTGIPPLDRPGLHLQGEPVRTFFRAYWNEIWNRGRLLNIRGVHDLSAIHDIALRLGLKKSLWNNFCEQARALEVGDGAPPLI